jgi:ABC-type transport system substrate-binding protein
LVELLFSGLLKYGKNGIEKDLVKDYKILEDGKTYQFSLREDIFWSDGWPITADDVIFTIEAIQSPDVKSPLRSAWLDVEIERISEKDLRFKLKETSFTFLENATLKIIPKHLWKEIPFKDFPLSILNLKPIGCGPYVLEDLKMNEEGKIKSIELKRNEKYHDQKPKIEKIIFKFFKEKSSLIKSWQKGEIMGFTLPEREDFQNLNCYSFPSPRYFAVFFNNESNLLKLKNIRKALNFSINKKEISKNAKIVDSPILPEIYGFDLPSKTYQFDLEKAKEILNEEGFKIENGKMIKKIKIEPEFEFKSDLKLGSQGKEVFELQKCLSKFPEIYPEAEITGYFGPKTREAVISFQEKYKEEILEPLNLKRGTGEVRKATRQKLNQICFERKEEIVELKLSLSTVNEEPLIGIAKKLKEQWEEIGIEIELRFFEPNFFSEKILKKRDYEMILFGQALGKIPDPFAFWHSSQTRDPGLNLSLYENKDCDKILENLRKTFDAQKRKEEFEKLQEILIEDAPALFLFRGDYFYFVSKKVKGIKEKMILDPSQRFLDIEDWYIKEKRVWK